MKIISINEKAAIVLAIQEIHHQPILVQLPTVFALVAAPTSQGAAQLDQLKSRVMNKNYGTGIGSLTTFLSQAKRDQLPDAFSTPAHYATLAGSFIRLPFRDERFQSKAIKDGTHQGLLLDGLYADLFARIEVSFAGYQPDQLWNYTNYSAPLITSCNVSGDPNGSIVEFDKAVDFAKQRGIGLFIKAAQPTTQTGSYPILGFEKNRVTIHRNGPSLDAFKTKIPAHLRSW